MTGYYGGYTEYLPNCHTGLTKVMRIGEADIYIGKGVDALAEGGWALMVSCAGSGVAYAPENPVKANKEAREFLPADVTTQPPPPLPLHRLAGWLNPLPHPFVVGAVARRAEDGEGRCGLLLPRWAWKVRHRRCYPRRDWGRGGEEGEGPGAVVEEGVLR